MATNTHAHITTWVVAIILFVVALSLLKAGNAKATKIVQMVLRVFYILIIVTGWLLLHNTNYSGEHLLKSIVGIGVIGAMEVLLARKSKGKPTGVILGIFIVLLIVVLYLGFSLPLGIEWF